VLQAGSLVTATWTFRRNLPLDNQVLEAAGRAVKLTTQSAAEFVEVVNGKREGVVLRGLYPRVWRLLGNGGPIPNYTTPQQSDCQLSLRGMGTPTTWWAVTCGEMNTGAERRSPCTAHGGGPEVVLVSSEVATGALASFSKLVGGLTGMYVVYVLAVGSFARAFTTNLAWGVWRTSTRALLNRRTGSARLYQR